MGLVGTFVIATLLAACASSRAAPPKWPKQTEREVDGGESLAPRKVIAEASDKAKAKADDDDDDDADDADAEPAKAATDASAAKEADATPEPPEEVPVAPPDEETPITAEEIVIEIEEEE